MNVTDILQLLALAALVFIPLGYKAHRFLPGLLDGLNAWLLTPRYLRPIKTRRVKDVLAQGKNTLSPDKQPPHD